MKMKPSNCGVDGRVFCGYCRNFKKKGFCLSTHPETMTEDTEIYCAGFKRSEKFYELLEQEKHQQEEQDKWKQEELFN